MVDLYTTAQIVVDQHKTIPTVLKLLIKTQVGQPGSKKLVIIIITMHKRGATEGNLPSAEARNKLRFLVIFVLLLY